MTIRSSQIKFALHDESKHGQPCGYHSAFDNIGMFASERKTHTVWIINIFSPFPFWKLTESSNGHLLSLFLLWCVTEGSANTPCTRASSIRANSTRVQHVLEKIHTPQIQFCSTLCIVLVYFFRFLTEQHKLNQLDWTLNLVSRWLGN